MELIDVVNSQNITLRGGFWSNVRSKDTCVLFVPGMAGNFIENKFIQVLGEECEKNGIAFLCGHNQGSFQICDLPYSNNECEKTSVRRGAAFEMFDDCIADISAYVDYITKCGFSNIVLIGHSLGANKVIYYLSKNNKKTINKYVLLSPQDITLLLETDENYKELYSEAREKVANGSPDKFLSEFFGGWCAMSAKRYVDLYENQNARNLPIVSGVGSFKQLKSIQKPLLVIAGSEDDIYPSNISTLLEQQTIEADNQKLSTWKIIDGANHTYDDKEKELAKEVLSFIKG